MSSEDPSETHYPNYPIISNEGWLSDIITNTALAPPLEWLFCWPECSYSCFHFLSVNTDTHMQIHTHTRPNNGTCWVCCQKGTISFYFISLNLLIFWELSPFALLCVCQLSLMLVDLMLSFGLSIELDPKAFFSLLDDAISLCYIYRFWLFKLNF